MALLGLLLVREVRVGRARRGGIERRRLDGACRRRLGARLTWLGAGLA